MGGGANTMCKKTSVGKEIESVKSLVKQQE